MTFRAFPKSDNLECTPRTWETQTRTWIFRVRVCRYANGKIGGLEGCSFLWTDMSRRAKRPFGRRGAEFTNFVPET
jgi:hypothetical protein